MSSAALADVFSGKELAVAGSKVGAAAALGEPARPRRSRARSLGRTGPVPRPVLDTPIAASLGDDQSAFPSSAKAPRRHFGDPCALALPSEGVRRSLGFVSPPASFSGRPESPPDRGPVPLRLKTNK